jgi:hypothetical protein
MGRPIIEAPVGTKWCNRGGHFQPLGDFGKVARSRDQKSYTCKSCMSKIYKEIDHYKKTYGISKSIFQKMLKDQRGCCASCGDQLKRPHLDHCHKTGMIRGILCHHCNIALGMLRDDPIRVMLLLEYLGGR